MYNVQNLKECAVLSAEQLNASLTGAFGSIHDTLPHAERWYFSPISTGLPYRCPRCVARFAAKDFSLARGLVIFLLERNSPIC